MCKAVFCLWAIDPCHTCCSTDLQQNFRMFEENRCHHTKSLKRPVTPQNYSWCMWTTLWHEVLDTPTLLSTFQHHGTPHVFLALQKMGKVRWKWCTVFLPLARGVQGMVIQGRTICQNERYASWIPFLAQTRKHQKCDALKTMERALDNLKSRLTGAVTPNGGPRLRPDKEKREKCGRWQRMNV